MEGKHKDHYESISAKAIGLKINNEEYQERYICPVLSPNLFPLDSNVI